MTRDLSRRTGPLNLTLSPEGWANLLWLLVHEPWLRERSVGLRRLQVPDVLARRGRSSAVEAIETALSLRRHQLEDERSEPASPRAFARRIAEAEAEG